MTKLTLTTYPNGYEQTETFEGCQAERIARDIPCLVEQGARVRLETIPLYDVLVEEFPKGTNAK